jgi:hypothetical protein
MPPQPAPGDRALDAGAVFGRRAAGREERPVDQLGMEKVAPRLRITRDSFELD